MLRLSTKGRYATRMLVYLSLNARERPANTQTIANAEGISKDYVEQILTRLRTAGIIASHRGIKGGFSIARDPKDITVKEVVEITEGPISIAPCIKNDCSRATQCATQVVWDAANTAIETALGAYTIDDLCKMSLKSENNISFQI